MKWKLLHGKRRRTFALVFDAGDEVLAGLLDFARENGVQAASFTGIGAFSDATLAFFQCEKKQYKNIPLAEQVEVLVLAGDITLKEGQPHVHAHVVVGRADGSTRGGHLLEAHVRPTLEVMLTDVPGRLERKRDERSGLWLIDLP